MNEVILIFASMTGNTEEIAQCIVEGIQTAGGTVTIKDVYEVNVEEMERYNGILLGSYTWIGGELPDEFLDIYEEMDQLHLIGKKAAVFGSGDSDYPDFGGAVDKLIEKLTELGADVAMEGLKIDQSPTEDEKERCKQFGVKFTNILRNNLNKRSAM